MNNNNLIDSLVSDPASVLGLSESVSSIPELTVSQDNTQPSTYAAALLKSDHQSSIPSASNSLIETLKLYEIPSFLFQPMKHVPSSP